MSDTRVELRRGLAFTPRTALVLAAWATLATGGVEAAYWGVKRYVLGEMAFMHPHFVWMAPAALAPLFFALAAIVWVFARRKAPADALAVAVSCFAFAALVNLSLLAAPGLHFASRLLLCGGLSALAGRTAKPHAASLERLAGRSALGMAATILVATAAVVSHERRPARAAMADTPAAPDDAPNVLLVVLDTVRADALSVYGADAGLTPNLARLAAAGVVFDDASATAPWTLPSQAGMFTGRPPHELSADWFSRLDNAHPTLAEALAGLGYATGAFVGNVRYCSAETGLDRGFGRYEGYRYSLADFARCTAIGRALMFGPLPAQLGYYDLPGRKRAPEINRSVLRWVADRGDRPYFAFVNYWDAHDPYVAPPEYRSTPLDGPTKRLLRDWWWAEKAWIESQQLAALRGCYEDCLRGLDHEFGRLLAELDRSGELANTCVIVTADHGEHFGEHDLYLHGNSLYQELLRVPLIVAWPGRVDGGRRVDTPVSLAGLPQTVCDLIDAAAGDRFPGPSFAGLVRGTGEEGRRASAAFVAEIASQAGCPPCHGRSPVAAGPMRCVRSGPLKLIERADGVRELFDLRVDPQERVNLADDPAFASTIERLRSTGAGLTEAADEPLDPSQTFAADGF
ncbi:sulfatase [Botrimarina sp.]|uniref:sulfatase n=1 Tax=Botrimarina sp. TaxID=2795802 RepID=UPI0032EABE2A